MTTSGAGLAVDHAALPYKPPLAFLLALVVGIGGHRLFPMHARPAGWAPIGVTIVALGVALVLWAATAFRAKRTPLEPWLPTTAIVTRGPFAYSRNPVYLGFALIQLGIGVWSDQLAVVAMVIPALVATHRWVVLREESYLGRKFGEEYREYRARVRRWL